MSTPKNPIRINFSNDDIYALLVEAIKKKHPELAEEEFEVTLTYDTYNYVYTASVEYQP